MTIKEYLDSLGTLPFEAPDSLKEKRKALALRSAAVWNNDACKGYCIAAAIAAGIDRNQTGKLMEALGAAFDEMTVDEAEQFFQSGEY